MNMQNIIPAGKNQPLRVLQRTNRRLKLLLLLATILLAIASISVVVLINNMPVIENNVSQSKDKFLQPNLNMVEVWRLLGKPDRVEVKEGEISGGLERPTVIIWHYESYPVADRAYSFGQSGHINFVPFRFPKISSKDQESGEINQKNSNRPDDFRTISFSGSFPIGLIDWGQSASFDLIPLYKIEK